MTLVSCQTNMWSLKYNFEKYNSPKSQDKRNGNDFRNIDRALYSYEFICLSKRDTVTV